MLGETPETSVTTVPPQVPEPADIAITKWKDYLPEDLKKTELVANSKNIVDFAGQAINAQKMIGSRIPLPKDTDDENAWNEVYNKLGRPNAPEGYKIERPQDSKYEYNEALEKQFLAEAHKAGLNNKQANALAKWQMEKYAADKAADEQAIASATEQLKREWGNKYDERISGMQRIIGEYEGTYPGLIAAIDTAGIGNNPAFIKFFHDIVEGLIEGNAPGGTPGDSGIVTAATAKAEVDKLMADKDFTEAYFNQRNPQHRAAVDRIMKLRTLASGG